MNKYSFTTILVRRIYLVTQIKINLFISKIFLWTTIYLYQFHFSIQFSVDSKRNKYE